MNAATPTSMNFSVSMAKDAQFTAGLRPFLEYRDLGIKQGKRPTAPPGIANVQLL